MYFCRKIEVMERFFNTVGALLSLIRKAQCWLVGITSVILLLVVFLMCHLPILTGRWTKQTVYLSILNAFHVQDDNAEARFMLIDDDSGDGIFLIREICNRLGIKATFAMVPARLDSTKCDSLRKWHDEGYGIALHGYEHGRWKEWSYEAITEDIDRSLSFLEKHQIADASQIRIVVTPGFYNTCSIRKAISDKGMKMVMGANVVNPDTMTFQWGRMFITNQTNLDEARHVLERAKETKGFIVFGTHSSMVDEFSAEKTEAILRMAIDMGFCYEDSPLSFVRGEKVADGV